MNMMARQQVSAAFSAAADYCRHARVQRLVARDLAAHIASLPLPRCPRILEIGCGTGFLTEALIARGIEAEWLITDISPEMLARCRERIGNAPDRQFATLDGEYGEPEGARSFDLICSSLAVQWFDDLDRAIGRMIGWLAPGGQCLFSTLSSGTFAEWRAAHAVAGFEHGTQRFTTVPQLVSMQTAHARNVPQVRRYVERHDSAFGFLRSLKAIGAHTASDTHRPLGPSAMRRVMRNFEQAGASVTYEVATCHYVRPKIEAA